MKRILLLAFVLTFLLLKANAFSNDLNKNKPNKKSNFVSPPVNCNDTASFVTSGLASCLNNFTILNTNTSTGIGATYFWDFGDGTSSTAVNPLHTYPTAGTYFIKLVATSSNGCKDSTTKSITLTAKPIAGFTINSSSQCFEGNSFELTNTATDNTTNFWKFGDGTNSILVSPPNKTYAAAGTYFIKLIVNDGNNCSDTSRKTVKFTAKPTPLFITTGAINCTNNLTIGTVNTSIGASNYAWSFGDGAIDTATNPTHTYATVGTYNIKLVVTSSNGCRDSLTRTITFTAKPTANSTINKDSQCVNGNSYAFTNTSLLVTSSVWNFGDGSATVSTPNASHTYTSAGIYTVKLVITSIDGCKDSITKAVTVFAKPTSLFTTTGATTCTNNLTIGTVNTSIGASN